MFKSFKEQLAKSLAEITVVLGFAAAIIAIGTVVDKISNFFDRLKKRKEDKFVDATPNQEE